MDLAEARRAAESVADRVPVQSRIEGYEARLAALESRVEELQGTLQELVEAHDAADIYSVARDLHHLRTAANEVQRQADDLSNDLEGFQDWLEDDEQRREEFGEDLELVEAELDAVATDIDALGEADAQRGRRWLDATLRRRLFELLLVDLRAEWEALRSWADQEAGSLADWDDFEARIEALEARHEALSTDLEDATDPDWRERFGDRIEAFSAAVAPADPPIDWAAVQSAFETHRPNVEPLSIE
jgi:chromosome segregation ATPase